MLLVAVAALVVTVTGPAKATPNSPEHIVLVSLPGITWADLQDADLPNIEGLMPSVAALSARTASRAPNIARGYLTLGSGNPSYAPVDDPQVNAAFEADASFEGGTALEAARRRTGRTVRGDIVHVGVPFLQAFQDERSYGSKVGSLGEALRSLRTRRAVVSAADIALKPGPEELRRGAVLALMDAGGAVDRGTLDGLLRSDPSAPFGVSTDAAAFVRAAREAMNDSTVVLLDPGETSRADEYATVVQPDEVQRLRRQALERTDQIVGRLRRLLGRNDVAMVAAPSGPTSDDFREHLAVIGAWSGDGVETASFGDTWLTSPTTRRQGMVVLSDIGPTILHLLGADSAKPSVMVGTSIRSGEPRDGGIDRLIELDRASNVRETFAAGAFWVIAIILSLLAILAFVAFLGRRSDSYGWLTAVAYFGLAVFPAAHVIRAFEFWSWGVIGAHAALYLVAAAIAAAAWFLPGPRWGGGVALMILAVLLFGSDVVMGGPLQVNGVFGHSPLVAGRFYGVSNPGYTILFAAALLGVTGLAELRGHRRLPLWGIAAIVALLPIVGLPSTGADFGGLLAGVPAVGVTIILGRGVRIRGRTILMLAAAAVVAALGLSFVDYLRPPEARTHLGRFAAMLVTGDAGDLGTLLERKGAAALNSLTVTRWTWFIPVGLAVLALLLLRPRGVLRDVLPGRPLLRAGLWGTVVAGVLGFAVNDSGISIPALALAFVVPFLVLVAVDSVAPRKPAPS